MKIIPVIDLLHGRVVRAIRGQRSAYRPWHSPLCPTADPHDLLDVLHRQHGFRTVYVADLDAILGQASHADLLYRLAAAFPALELWLDAGYRTAADLSAPSLPPRCRAVIGSESWADTRGRPPAGSLLSVDSDAHGPRDPSGICADPQRRPGDLILMNLTRVGSDQGPDLDLLRHWRHCAPAAQLYLAGGIRDHADLAHVRAQGAAGVLLASALHATDSAGLRAWASAGNG